jgi:CRISPR-associated Csx2 family protein
MAKILISPLGLGGRSKGTDKYEREYQETCYHIDDKRYPSSRFVATVLYEHFQLDGIIFIGTVRSMWEEVYRFFCEKNGVEMDEAYWLQLAEKIDTLNYNSPLDSLDLSRLREVLGDRSQCLLIKYGINQTELWENFDRIIQVVDTLEKGDKVYIDITTSFRSLSFFQFLTITFINDLLTEKKIEIAGVYYGMLDVTRELGYTPIVDLKPMFEMTSWIKGAYSLKNYGNGELISKLLNAQGESQLATCTHNLSQAININYVNAIKQRSSDLKSALRNSVPNGPFKYVRKILDNFVQRFTRTSASEADFQLELSGWYFDNQRYATGYITLTEAIITYVCEINDKDPKQQSNRREVQDWLHQSENNKRELAQLYFKINPIRNSIAHASLDASIRIQSFSDAIQNAQGYQKTAKTIFGTKTLGNEMP